MNERYRPLSLKEEQQDREDQQELLRSLPGFLTLREEQQRLLTTSLYVQQRAERATDEASRRQIPEGTMVERPEIIRRSLTGLDDSSGEGEHLPETYTRSQDHIAMENCHSAVEALAQGQILNLEVPIEFHSIKSESDLEAFIELEIETKELPLVLQVRQASYKYPMHSALILGKDQNGRWMVWEKYGYGLPYQLVELKSLLSTYTYGEWGVQSLKLFEESFRKTAA